MLKCKKCGQEKELFGFYKHIQWKFWVMQPCKECKKDYARSDKYRIWARKRDYDRYHFDDKRRLYVVWCWMNSRCYNKDDNSYRWYWAKWKKVVRENFKKFKKDMFKSYVSHYKKNWWHNTQIDRINNDWDYCKENCRRVTAKENVNNKSKVF